MPVVFVNVCPLFRDTYAKKIQDIPGLKEKLEKFIKFKSENPASSFGSSDKQGHRKDPFSVAVPGIKHAHLTFDVSVFYVISGKDPLNIYLYGIFSHDEAGTGQPGNPRKRDSLAARFKKQSF